MPMQMFTGRHGIARYVIAEEHVTSTQVVFVNEAGDTFVVRLNPDGELEVRVVEGGNIGLLPQAANYVKIRAVES